MRPFKGAETCSAVMRFAGMCGLLAAAFSLNANAEGRGEIVSPSLQDASARPCNDYIEQGAKAAPSIVSLVDLVAKSSPDKQEFETTGAFELRLSAVIAHMKNGFGEGPITFSAPVEGNAMVSYSADSGKLVVGDAMYGLVLVHNFVDIRNSSALFRTAVITDGHYVNGKSYTAQNAFGVRHLVETAHITRKGIVIDEVSSGAEAEFWPRGYRAEFDMSPDDARIAKHHLRVVFSGDPVAPFFIQQDIIHKPTLDDATDQRGQMQAVIIKLSCALLYVEGSGRRLTRLR